MSTTSLSPSRLSSTLRRRAGLAPLRLLRACLLAAGLVGGATPARAGEGDDGDPLRGPAIERRDASPHELWSDAGSPTAPIWVGLEAAMMHRSGARDFAAMLLVGVPLDRVARRSPSGAASIAQTPTLKPAPRSKASRAERGAGPGPVPAESPTAEIELPIVVSPPLARAVAREALRHARLESPEARLDALATRARTSALLPELRLRVTRLVDESENLSPTEYDAERTTASGGTSLWLEARATWRLDRLVFADEEVPIERLRQDRAGEQAKVVARALELLFAWQRASALEGDPARTPNERLEARLRAIEAVVSLDLATGGWFSAWLGDRAPAPSPSPPL